jgi:hypothetical protein
VLGVEVVIAASNKLGGTVGEAGAGKETGEEPIGLENAQRSYVTQHTQQPRDLLDLASLPPEETRIFNSVWKDARVRAGMATSHFIATPPGIVPTTEEFEPACI